MSGFKEFIEGPVRRGDVEEARLTWRDSYKEERDSRGWTLLHWACSDSGGYREGLVRLLLFLGCDGEAETTGRKWRPIHFCACHGLLGAAKAILESGCSPISLTANETTPLRLAEKNKKDDVAALLISAINVYTVVDSALHRLKNEAMAKVMLSKAGNILVERLITKKDKKVLEAIMRQEIDEQEINDWHSLKTSEVDPQTCQVINECLIMRCLHQKYDHGAGDLFTADLVNGDPLIMKPTALETAVAFGSALWVKDVLRRVVNENDSWKRAEEIAMRNKWFSIAWLISSRRDYLNRQRKIGVSRLHIAVIENDPDLVDYLLKNRLVDPGECHKNLGPAITLAYGIGHTECAQRLQTNNVNVNRVDRWGQTPLHVAISNKTEEHCGYLVDHTDDIEVKDLMGMKVLARSVLNDCKDICERLVKKGAKCDQIITISSQTLQEDPDLVRPRITIMNVTGQETIHSLCLKVNHTIYPCLLHKIDRSVVNMKDGEGNTLLHLSAVSLMPAICSQLISKSANVNALNQAKGTPLLELLKRNAGGNVKEIWSEMIETVNVLMEGGASLDLEDADGCSPIEEATLYSNENLLLALLPRSGQSQCVHQSQWLAWIDRGYFRVIRQITSSMKPSLLNEWITVEIITCMLKPGDASLAKLMYDHGSSEVRATVAETILYHAAVMGDMDTFRSILDGDVSSRGSLKGGDSLLHLLIKDRKADYIQHVISSKNCHIFVEKVNSENKLPLHVCIECDYWDVLDQMIANTGTMDVEDISGNTPLSLLLTKISVCDDEGIILRLLTFIKLLIGKSANIDLVNRQNRKIITYCTNENLRRDVVSFFQRNQHHQRGLMAPSELSPQDPLCSICEEEPKNCALNCGHIFGMSCAEKTLDCYVCRQRITDRRKVYL